MATEVKLLHKAVAHPTDGFYHVCCGGIASCLRQLLPDAENLHVDGTLRHWVGGTLDVVDDLDTGKDPAGMTCQMVQDGEFRGGKDNGCPFEASLELVGDDGKPMDGNLLVLLGLGVGLSGLLLLGAAQHRLDPGHQHLGGKGLGDVVVGPQLQSGNDVRVGTLRSSHDDGNVGRVRVVAENAADVEATHVRQHQV